MTKAKSKLKVKFKNKQKPRKPKLVFTKINKHQPKGFADELRETLKAITIRDAVNMAEIMRVETQELMTPAGINMDIRDIECYEGGVKDAADSMEYWFHAGPARTFGESKNNYVLIKGSVLNWTLDAIMFRLSYDGYKILHDLGIPL